MKTTKQINKINISTMKNYNIPANYNNVQTFFNVGELTASRILNNCCYGFFVTHFGEEKENKWREAHPFKYPAHDSINFHEISLEFIKNNFELLATNQLTISSGWKYDEQINKMYWNTDITYRKETNINE